MAQFCAETSRQRVQFMFPHLLEWPVPVECHTPRGDKFQSLEFYSDRLACVYVDMHGAHPGRMQIYVNDKPEFAESENVDILYYTHPGYFRKPPKNYSQDRPVFRCLHRNGIGLYSFSNFPLRPHRGCRKHARVRMEFSFSKKPPEQMFVFVQNDAADLKNYAPRFDDGYYYWYIHKLWPYFSDPYNKCRYKTRREYLQELSGPGPTNDEMFENQDYVLYKYHRHHSAYESNENKDAYDKYGS